MKTVQFFGDIAFQLPTYTGEVKVRSGIYGGFTICLVNGSTHRDMGPAIVSPSSSFYCQHGEFVSSEDYWKRMYEKYRDDPEKCGIIMSNLMQLKKED